MVAAEAGERFPHRTVGDGCHAALSVESPDGDERGDLFVGDRAPEVGTERLPHDRCQFARLMPAYSMVARPLWWRCFIPINGNVRMQPVRRRRTLRKRDARRHIRRGQEPVSAEELEVCEVLRHDTLNGLAHGDGWTHELTPDLTPT